MTEPKFPPMPTVLSGPPMMTSIRSRSTCATCRFMAEPREDFYAPADVTSNDVDKPTEHATCVRIIHGNEDYRDEAMRKASREPALVIDGSGYEARLIVLPTFGCVLHEAKP